MPLHIEDEKQDRELHPAGLKQATCLFVEDAGLQRTKGFQGKPDKIQRKGLFLWETAAKKADGSQFLVLLSRTLSTFDKAQLRQDVEGLLGKKMTDEEAKGFDWDISGKSGLLSFVHETGKDGKTYSNVKSMSPLMDGMNPYKPVTTERPEWFVKYVADLKAKAVTASAASPSSVPAHTEDDLPF